ncbi:hypothetical protein CVT25_001364 [Psilocybe cyanescens]|uniref:Uncharacterized protein n=1 Tax=Psilocybe cyanescens TaxID=93625 RepID=A0A409W9R2_PSICY|nr:hypothetical protein CVT25_001364 [Psilocybe cyanescens]
MTEILSLVGKALANMSESEEDTPTLVLVPVTYNTDILILAGKALANMSESEDMLPQFRLAGKALANMSESEHSNIEIVPPHVPVYANMSNEDESLAQAALENMSDDDKVKIVSSMDVWLQVNNTLANMSDDSDIQIIRNPA